MVGISFFSMNHKLDVPAAGRNGESVLIPIRFIPFMGTPLLDIELEGKKYSLDVDLGCSYLLCLDSKVLDGVKSKEPAEEIDTFDIHGKKHTLRGFKLPKFSIEKDLIISGAIARVESVDFIQEGSQILPDIPFLHKTISKIYLFSADGRVGWPIFKELKCFFDFPNSVIFLAKELESLKSHINGSLDEFTRTTFDLSPAGIILETDTDLGKMRFLLDSGSTWSLLQKTMKRGNLSFVSQKFEINGINLGRQKFWFYELPDHLKIDGILGVDFFKKNAICIDFHNKDIYIKPHPSVNDQFMAWISSP